MNQFEAMSFAKYVMSAFSGNVTPSDVENEIGATILKNMADNAPYWNQRQKEAYKLLVDIVKEDCTK